MTAHHPSPRSVAGNAAQQGEAAMRKKERVQRAIEFRGPDRVPFCTFEPWVGDIFFMAVAPARDWQPDEPYYPHTHPVAYYLNNWRFRKPVPLDVQSPKYERQDEFGCVWRSSVEDTIGEVVGHPLKSWDDLERFRLPDPYAPGRLERFIFFSPVVIFHNGNRTISQNINFLPFWAQK